MGGPGSAHGADRPEVRRQVAFGEVRVRHGEVAAHTPARAPGIAYQESLGGVVVSDGQYGVNAEDLFVRSGQGDDPGMADLVAFEALVDCEPEHEGVALR